MTVIRVLSPIGVDTGERVSVPALPRDLSGRTIGFLDNTKHNFDRLVAEVGSLLRERPIDLEEIVVREGRRHVRHLVGLKGGLPRVES